MKIQLNQANNFFYQFYNNNIKDTEILNFLPTSVYIYVLKEIIKYNLIENPKIKFNVFCSNLKQQIDIKFKSEIIKFQQKIIKQNNNND